MTDAALLAGVALLVAWLTLLAVSEKTFCFFSTAQVEAGAPKRDRSAFERMLTWLTSADAPPAKVAEGGARE